MTNQNFPYKAVLQGLSRVSLVLIVVTLAACMSVPRGSFDNAWIEETIDYKHNFNSSHPDSTESILKLDFELKQEIIGKFKSYSSENLIATDLAKWLISEDGHGMIYDVAANLNPMEAFEQKKGNCLSFTLLFSALAAELGVAIEFNIVDIPNAWGLNNDTGYILYRHINGILKTSNKRQVYDLALEFYDFNYPQKIIPREHAIAQLHSNKAVDNLEDGNFVEALHLIKLAISLSPKNEDLWVNLGAILNQQGDHRLAEQSFLYAYYLNSKSEVAASRLERFYTTSNQPEKAKAYQAAAFKARQSNPYYLYETANTFYQQGSYKKARSQIKKAIRLHAEDPSFYELSSRVSQKLRRYDLALKDVLIAYQLSHGVDEQNRYANKARLISKLTTKQEISRLLD